MATPSTASKGGSAHESVEFVAPSVPTTVSTTVFVFVVVVIVIVIVIVPALHVGHAAFALLGFVATPTTSASASASACWTNAAKVVLVVALDARVGPVAVFVLPSLQSRK